MAAQGFSFKSAAAAAAAASQSSSHNRRRGSSSVAAPLSPEHPSPADLSKNPRIPSPGQSRPRQPRPGGHFAAAVATHEVVGRSHTKSHRPPSSSLGLSSQTPLHQQQQSHQQQFPRELLRSDPPQSPVVPGGAPGRLTRVPLVSSSQRVAGSNQVTLRLKEDHPMLSAALGKSKEQLRQTEAKLLESLNTEQRAAVTTTGSPLMIVASAGSGKTRTLMAKIAFEINRGRRADQILAVTFTRKAALEMRTRIERTLGWTLTQGIHVSNFHQLCLRILREYYNFLGFQQQFLVLGNSEQRKVISQCLRQLGMWTLLDLGSVLVSETDDILLQADEALMDDSLGGANQRSFASFGGGGGGPNQKQPSKELVHYAVNFIRKAKAESKHPSDFPPRLAQVFRAYIDELKRQMAIDFSDMIPLTLHLLTARPDVLVQCQARYRYIFVDEFQDVSADQVELLRLLSEPTKGMYLTVCGDDDQSIYGWRGAAVHAFEVFKQLYPDSRTVHLGQTYRCSQTIVEAMDAVIRRNTRRQKKHLWTTNSRGNLVELMVANSESAEAAAIGTRVQHLKERLGLPYSSFAVLARTNRSLQVIASTLERMRLPIRGRTPPDSGDKLRPPQNPIQSLHRSREAKDLAAYLSLAARDTDDAAFLRICNRPARGMTDKVIQILQQVASVQQIPLMRAARNIASKMVHPSQPLTGRQLTCLQALVSVVDRIREIALWQDGAAETASAAQHPRPEGLLMRQIIDKVIQELDFATFIRKNNPQAKPDAVERKVAALKVLTMLASDFDADQQHSLVAKQCDPEERILRFVAVIERHVVSQSDAGSSADVSGGGGDDLGQMAIPDAVVLSTIHQAKGLEWPVVFVARFNYGQMPIVPLVDDMPAMDPSGNLALDAEAEPLVGRSALEILEEERRLAYVAMSRAQKLLVLSYSLVDPMGYPLSPSPYLADIPDELTVGVMPDSQCVADPRQPSVRCQDGRSEAESAAPGTSTSPSEVSRFGPAHLFPDLDMEQAPLNIVDELFAAEDAFPQQQEDDGQRRQHADDPHMEPPQPPRPPAESAVGHNRPYDGGVCVDDHSGLDGVEPTRLSSSKRRRSGHGDSGDGQDASEPSQNREPTPKKQKSASSKKGSANKRSSTYPSGMGSGFSFFQTSLQSDRR